MKKTILSIVLAITLVLAYAVPAAATEAEVAVPETTAAAEEITPNTAGTAVSEDPEIQAAYDAYKAMEAAYAAYDYAAMKVAVTELDDLTFDFDDQQTEEWEQLVKNTIGYQAFLEAALSANAIVNTVNAYEAFMADKNAATAKAYIELYEEVTVEWDLEVDKYVPGTAAAYEDAKANYLPDENVVKLYDAYKAIEEVLALSWYDEDFFEAYDGFEAVLDIFNELTEEELGELAVLMGVENGEAAWNKIFIDWINANLVKELGAVYDEYNSDPNTDTARAFVDKYESILNDTGFLTDDDKAVILAFFDESVYEGAKELLAADVDEGVTEGTNKSDKDESPKTGDESNMLAPFAVMLAAAGVAAAAMKRKRVQ